ncbi:hypothetical protein M378DRAFT_182110 [Amanita muscaria Koide BX008]|uniref:Uncharacterized protein n=1 Tax=Amanita muscaria (strain Koide BX008) TaxID=946122 RepID=A0A0C2W461_AMAMK|nr:hypothetical protein M378DRAFT_182110 [Amanita muscaria Koide BX008]
MHVENPWAVKPQKKPGAKRSAKQVLLGVLPKRSRKRSRNVQEPTPDVADDRTEDTIEPAQVFAEPLEAIAAPAEDTTTTICEPFDALSDAGHALPSVKRSNRIAAQVSRAYQLRWGSSRGELTREEDDYDSNDDSDERGVQGMDIDFSDGEDEDEDEDEDDWRKCMSAAPGQEGIPLWDLLGEGFLAAASELDGTILDEDDKALLRAYAYKVDEKLTDKAYNKLPYVFPSASCETLKRTEARVQYLSGFQPIRYDRCINTCICYTGPVAIQKANLKHISHTSLLSLDFAPWLQTPRVHPRCDIEGTTSMIHLT